MWWAIITHRRHLSVHIDLAQNLLALFAPAICDPTNTGMLSASLYLPPVSPPIICQPINSVHAFDCNETQYILLLLTFKKNCK